MTAQTCGLGLALAVAGGNALESLLFGVDGSRPWILVGVALLLPPSALAAAALPALKVVPTDVVRAVREPACHSRNALSRIPSRLSQSMWLARIVPSFPTTK